MKRKAAAGEAPEERTQTHAGADAVGEGGRLTPYLNMIE